MANYKGDYKTRESDIQFSAYNDFKKIFGRDPSDAELAKAMGGYQSGDPNVPNLIGGQAFIADMYQQMNPNADNQKNAPEKYGEVDAMFNQYVGRAASQEEKDHFGSLLASGQFDSYQIGEALKNLPETVRAQDTEFRKSLGTELQASDERYFNENIMPGIQSQFAKQGRSVDATGFQNALAREATGQNRQREAFLSDLTARQYEGSKGRAYEEYAGNRDYTRGRSDMLADRNTQRLYDIQNFAMQKQSYDDYLRRYGKRSSGMGQGIGSLVGMGLGAAFAAPTGGMSLAGGAMLGGAAGGAAGGIGDSFWK